MSNRTNRTLSANTNRLNLGTRSLATLAGVNNGTTQTLRLRLAHASHVGSFARVGRTDIDPAMMMITPPKSDPAKPGPKWAAESAELKPSPESSSRSSWPVPVGGRGYRVGTRGQQVAVVAEQPPVPRGVVVTDAPVVRSGRQAGMRLAASARACRSASRATPASTLAAVSCT